MDFRKGDKVTHVNLPDEHGVGTIVDVRGHGEEREYEVAWPMPVEGAISTSRWEPATGLQPAEQ